MGANVIKYSLYAHRLVVKVSLTATYLTQPTIIVFLLRYKCIMIEYVKGAIAELTPAVAVIDCNGLGYAVNISLNTYSAIQGKGECKLYVYEAIREDAYTLYGFADKQERELFLLLISVSGIGGNTARMILSALSANELVNAISAENANLLKGVKGIGLKTAQRIIVDLKDKINTVAASSGTTLELPAAHNNEVAEEAVAALTMLGFPSAPSQKVVAAIVKEEPDAAVEKVIKMALKRL
jgi:Holliday junction DNA helicase RuvA